MERWSGDGFTKSRAQIESAPINGRPMRFATNRRLKAVNEMATERNQGMDLRELLVQLVAARWWVALSLLVCTSAFGAFAFLSTPIFRASVVLIPATADRNSLSGSLGSVLGQAGGIVSLLGVGTGSADASTEEALAVLRSREFTEKFIADGELMPKFFPQRWDSERKAWKTSKKIPTLAKGVKYFDDRIRSIDQDKKTGLVVLQIDWRNRYEASEWANGLVKQLNSEMQARAITKADASLTFLEKELTTTAVLETREAINRLIEAQIKQRMIAHVTSEFAFRVVDKAMPPDEDDPVKPKKPLLLALGFFAGIALSVSVLAIKSALRAPG
jgi:uncharacterized protein involved in exopolysaccharide biosynthesis